MNSDSKDKSAPDQSPIPNPKPKKDSPPKQDADPPPKMPVRSIKEDRRRRKPSTGRPGSHE